MMFYSGEGFAVQHLVLGTVATRVWRAELRPIAVGMVVHQVTYYNVLAHTN